MERRWTRINRQSFKIGFKSVNEGADSDDENHDPQGRVSKRIKLAKRRYISKVILRSRSDEGISFEDYENQMNGSNRFDLDNFRSIPNNLHLCELISFVSHKVDYQITASLFHSGNPSSNFQPHQRSSNDCCHHWREELFDGRGSY